MTLKTKLHSPIRCGLVAQQFDNELYNILTWWLGGSVVKALDWGPRGCEFDSRPVCYQLRSNNSGQVAHTYVPAYIGARGLVVGFDS